MNFGEAADYLASRIKRPDKVSNAESAINRAISVFATSNFYHDMVEPPSIALVAQSYVQAIDITASPFTRFRKIKYLRPTGYRKYITWRDPAKIFDQGGCEAFDVWYRGGNYIRFKLSNLQPSLEVGYYQYHLPMTAPEDVDWMLNEIWPAVEAYALAELQQDIGNTEESSIWQRKWPALLQTYRGDIGDAVSYG